MFRKSFVYFCLFLFSFSSYAQETKERRDTLHASHVLSDRRVARDAGTRVVEVPALSTVVSATGEADAIKYIQTLPGVSTGAEGSSAVYVRGGNLGSNLITLDGVPLYGSSHLLGMTGVYPNDIISSMSFRLGGFRGYESNLTSSHIGLVTSDGNLTESSFGLSASNFMLGGTVSMPLVREKVSLLASVRVSPLGPEFRAIQSIVGGALDSLSRPGAVVYDAFAKVNWSINDNNAVSFSVFNSMDSYSYCYGGYSDERIGWGNTIISIRHEGVFCDRWNINNGMAYNRFANNQGVIRDMNGAKNNIAIVSSLDELTLDAVISRHLTGVVSLSAGIRERIAWFNPGTSSIFKGGGPLQPLDSPRTDNKSHSSITTVHSQMDFNVGERLNVMGAARLNACFADEPGVNRINACIDPEFSFMADVKINRWLNLEVTADWTVQYYHTLEGIPLGWSVDLLVPTSPSCPPEYARQFYAGVFTSFGQHKVTLGAYEKAMRNLIYFADAGKLFSSTIAGWNSNISVGSGTSKGLEFMYEKDGARLDWRIAYTLSNTDRQFDDVNNGVSFPAKFDRRHILNATTSYVIADDNSHKILLTGSYTWQSGHWVTVVAGEYPSISITGHNATLDYFTSVNNYKMPSYIRFDLGCNITFKARYEHSLNIGVYNIMNRHNPLSIIYDDREKVWKQVSLIPILPSFNYKIKF